MRHSSSPLGSTGSSNESWPLLSKDEDAEMYSPHRHKINEVDDINRTDSEEQEDISEEDDRQEEWNQVILNLLLKKFVKLKSFKLSKVPRIFSIYVFEIEKFVKLNGDLPCIA